MSESASARVTLPNVSCHLTDALHVFMVLSALVLAVFGYLAVVQELLLMLLCSFHAGNGGEKPAG